MAASEVITRLMTSLIKYVFLIIKKNLSAFNMITGINELKTLTEDISCNCKSKFDGKNNVIQIKSGTMINVGASVKNIKYLKKLYLESC